jgi:hypothetical protein
VGRVRRIVEVSAGWTRLLRQEEPDVPPAPGAEPVRGPESVDPPPVVVPDYDPTWEPEGEVVPTFPGLRSQACTAAQIDTEPYAEWCERFGHPYLVHRKQWEWCYIVQALTEHGVVRQGSLGLGFGVGTEPLASLLAARGCELVATDLPIEHDGHLTWASVEQHAESIEKLNVHGLCDADVLMRSVSFRPVDMNDIPDDLTDFDFVWSSCALEHLGDLDAGRRFIHRSMDSLRPGGVAVHTTEFNVSSNDDTVEVGETVAYRRRDLERIVDELHDAGHRVDITFALGDRPADRHIDVLPFTNTHLKVLLEGHVITSFGLIVRSGVSA